MNRRTGLALFLLLAFPGCNSGGDSVADAGVDAGGAVDAGLPPMTAEAIANVTRGLGVAAALSAPLVPSGTALHGDLAPTDTTAHMRSQDGFSGHSVVTPATCAAYSWAGLSATITLTGCTLEATGEPISGSLTLAVTTRPTTFTVSVTALTIGSDSFTGHVTLTINGTDLMPAPPTIDIDLMYTSAGTTTHLSATGVSVTTVTDPGTMMLTSISISGSASLDTGGAATSLVFTSLTWKQGDCLPSAGALVATVGTAAPATITFLPTTPMDGIVTVQVFPPPIPPAMVMLFPACP